MRPRHRLVALVVALSLAWITAGTLYGITNGRPDGENHPYVGFLLFYAPDSNGDIVPQWYCSGALISPTVVLTAGHCTDGASYAVVYFRADLRVPDAPGIKGDAFTHPGFSWDWPEGLLGWEAVDTGVVVLQSAVTDRGYAALPQAGFVDGVPTGTTVDIVGYGAQYKDKTSGPPDGRWAWTGERYSATTQIAASDHRNSDMWMKVSANPAKGKGGICFGDSGGPDLLAGTDIILATNSFVTNANCAGVDYSNRVDRAVVLDWVNGFLQ